MVDLENHNIKQNKVTIEVVKYRRCSETSEEFSESLIDRVQLLQQWVFFMIYGVFLLHFKHEITYKLDMLHENGYFCAFPVDVPWEQRDISFFTNSKKYG